MTAILELEGVAAAYGAARVLHSVDLKVEQGGITALLGANGAGKTTTLRAICNLIVRRSGTIRFDGRPLEGMPTEDIVRLGIAHVPDGRGTFVGLTVEENLRLGAYTRRDRGEVAADFERVYGYFPRLRERGEQQAGTLSGGEQQMLAIARALVRDPKIILLDEPFEGLAPVIVRDLINACRDLAAAGQTIVLVEQNLAATLTLAQRIYIINNGHIVHEGPAQELRAQPELLQRYIGV